MSTLLPPPTPTTNITTSKTTTSNTTIIITSNTTISNMATIPPPQTIKTSSFTPFRSQLYNNTHLYIHQQTIHQGPYKSLQKSPEPNLLGQYISRPSVADVRDDRGQCLQLSGRS